MRFDGYHVLSDILSMRNLQTRAFALTKWKLREILFGLNAPAPEQFSKARQRVLITYAILTWIYRFVLFLGIAIMVYYLFFKALGIILFVIEIVYFILHPIYRELKIWWSMKANISLNKNTLILSIILLILIGLFFIPWQSQVSLPATLSYQTKPLYTEIAARVISVDIKKGDYVKKGQLLAQLTSDQLDFQIAQANEKLKQLIWQQRNSVHFQTKLDQQQVLQTQINHTKTQLTQLQKQQDKLRFIAPFDGIVESLSEDLQPDAWLKAKQALMLIVNNQNLQLRAYTTADDQDQLKLNQKGYFVPENIDLAKIPVEIKYIVSSQSSVFKSQNENKANLSYIHEAAPLSAYHASNFGGSIAVNPNKEGKLTPQENVFLILLSLNSPLPYKLPHVVRGKVFIDIERKSLAARLWQQVLILWVKESGF
ncbi:HlyD family efflux transporter periplasmic adaptor subunit [Cysteiniphilum sp. 6C5]|uniref:HlyD family efflux transporter periplasmic adaptor subunit n=2 Tax=Cysteiniphilum TaxID=2056696 RepID=UPI003F836F75